MKKTMNHIKKIVFRPTFIAMYIGGEHKAHVVLVGNKKGTIKKSKLCFVKLS